MDIQEIREREELLCRFLLTRSDHALPACPASKIIQPSSRKEKTEEKFSPKAFLCWDK